MIPSGQVQKPGQTSGTRGGADSVGPPNISGQHRDRASGGWRLSNSHSPKGLVRVRVQVSMQTAAEFWFSGSIGLRIKLRQSAKAPFRRPTFWCARPNRTNAL